MKRLLAFVIFLAAFLFAVFPCGAEEALFPARGENGLWGFLDRTGAFALPAQFASVSPWMGRYAAVSADGERFGIIDGAGHFALPMEYDITWLEGGQGHLFQVMDSQSELIPALALLCGDQTVGFFDGDTGLFSGFAWKWAALPWFDKELIPVLDEALLWGYASRETGEIVIPCQFREAEEFRGDWAFVTLPDREAENGKPAFISRQGEKALAPSGYTLDAYTRAGDGLFAVYDENERFGYMNAAGDIVIPTRYAADYPFHGSWAVVEDTEGNYRYIHRDGSLLPGVTARPEGRGGYEFVNGLTSVFVGGQPGAMNEQGEILWTLEGENIFWLWNFMENGLAWYMEWHPEAGEGWYEQLYYGLADSQGRFLTESVFPAVLQEEGSPFREGLAAVRGEEGWGYIDETGAWAIPQRYAAARSFENGLALVEKRSGERGYIDAQGHEIYFWQGAEETPFWHLLE